MTFALHCCKSGEGGWETNGWRGMQPCIDSPGSEGLHTSSSPPLLCVSRLLQSLTCQLKHGRGNVSKLSKWRLLGQSGDGIRNRAKGRREEGAAPNMSLLIKAQCLDLGPALYLWNGRRSAINRALSLCVADEVTQLAKLYSDPWLCLGQVNKTNSIAI